MTGTADPDLPYPRGSENPDEVDAKTPAHSPIRLSTVRQGEINPTLAVKNHAEASIVKLKKTAAWEWGFQVQGGRSGLSSGLGKGMTAGGALNFASPPNNFGGNGVVTYPESGKRPGFGFSAGLVFTKRLSRRTRLALGLDYALFTTSIKVGSRVDSQAMGQQALPSGRNADQLLYRGGVFNSYTNKYHFIGLPVVFQAQLNRKQSFPFYYNAGISLSRLVASNALHYDNGAQVYFKDNGLIRKTQVAFLTGISMRFSVTNHFQVEAGPHLHYGLNRLLKGETAEGKRLVFAGLKAAVLF